MLQTNDRSRMAAERIRDQIPIVRVLADYGYPVRDDAGDREQQFSCDLHGDGRDNKPSARVYPTSGSWYCFACSKVRDSIETVRAKEGLDFWPAVRFLETRYNLPPLPWGDEQPQEKENLRGSVQQQLDPTRSFSDELRVIQASLEWSTQDRVLPMDQTLSFWEAVDQVSYMVKESLMADTTGRQMLQALQMRLDKALGVT